MKNKLAAALVAGAALLPHLHAHGATYSNLQDTVTHSEEQVSNIVRADWLAIESTGQESIELLGRTLHLAPNTKAIAGSTSETLFIAVLSGEVTYVNQKPTQPGNVLISSHDSLSAAASVVYDAEDFADRLTRLGSSKLASVLEPVISEQSTMKFWGLLRPSKINVNKPYNAVYEQGRRKYLLPASILKLKQSSQTEAELTHNTASAFVGALQDGHSETVEELLSPLMFVSEGKTPFTSDEWQLRRKHFAGNLVSKSKGKQVVPPKQHDSRDAFIFFLDNKEYLLKLHAFDGAMFVKEVVRNK